MSSLDYILCGYAKPLAYADKPTTIDALVANIIHGIRDIRPEKIEKLAKKSSKTNFIDYNLIFCVYFYKFKFYRTLKKHPLFLTLYSIVSPMLGLLSSVSVPESMLWSILHSKVQSLV